MMKSKEVAKNHSRLCSGIVLLVLAFNLSGCATGGYTTKIVTGMLAGAAVGAATGQIIYQGQGSNTTRNTIISSVVTSLITGGALAWHYEEMEQTKVEISGRYARYRLCDPEDLQSDLARGLEQLDKSDGTVSPLESKQIGKLSIFLDDSTRWAYPAFRKRYLLPELGENQVISKRYIWEIMKPGNFVTRSQNPEYFLDIKSLGKEKEPDDLQ